MENEETDIVSSPDETLILITFRIMRFELKMLRLSRQIAQRVCVSKLCGIGFFTRDMVLASSLQLKLLLAKTANRFDAAKPTFSKSAYSHGIGHHYQSLQTAAIIG